VVNFSAGMSSHIDGSCSRLASCVMNFLTLGKDYEWPVEGAISQSSVEDEAVGFVTRTRGMDVG